jgi:hypothetical protein
VLFDSIEWIEVVIYADLDPMGAIIVGIVATCIFFNLTLFQDCFRYYPFLGPHRIHRIWAARRKIGASRLSTTANLQGGDLQWGH